jgi:hypothetical protein
MSNVFLLTVAVCQSTCVCVCAAVCLLQLILWCRMRSSPRHALPSAQPTWTLVESLRAHTKLRELPDQTSDSASASIQEKGERSGGDVAHKLSSSIALWRSSPAQLGSCSKSIAAGGQKSLSSNRKHNAAVLPLLCRFCVSAVSPPQQRPL